MKIAMKRRAHLQIYILTETLQYGVLPISKPLMIGVVELLMLILIFLLRSDSSIGVPSIWYSFKSSSKIVWRCLSIVLENDQDLLLVHDTY